jgi:hypothetical protein
VPQKLLHELGIHTLIGHHTINCSANKLNCLLAVYLAELLIIRNGGSGKAIHRQMCKTPISNFLFTRVLAVESKELRFQTYDRSRFGSV